MCRLKAEAGEISKEEFQVAQQPFVSSQVLHSHAERSGILAFKGKDSTCGAVFPLPDHDGHIQTATVKQQPQGARKAG